MSKKLLTVAVAAYNVEKFLDQTLNSLMLPEEYLGKLDVVIVDDGSKDGTARIAAKYTRKVPEVFRLIRKENGGHGSAINRGIEEAEGKFFRALDGDDWIDREGLIQLMKNLEALDVDMVVTDYVLQYSSGKSERISSCDLEEGRVYDFSSIAPAVSYLGYHTVIYKTSILKDNHIHLDEHCFYVDREFMLFPILHIQNIAYLRLSLYCYRIGVEGQSVSPARRRKYVSNCDKVTMRLLEFYSIWGSSMDKSKREYVAAGIADHYVWNIDSHLMFKPSRKRVQEIRKIEEELRCKAEEIYVDVEKRSNKIRMLRKTGYRIYTLVVVCDMAKGKLREIKNKFVCA